MGRKGLSYRVKQPHICILSLGTHIGNVPTPGLDNFKKNNMFTSQPIIFWIEEFQCLLISILRVEQLNSHQ